MNLKNRKGFTGVDISIALTVIVLFVSVITTLLYNFSLNSKRLERKGEASYIAIQILEKIKLQDYDTVSVNNMDIEEIIQKYPGYSIGVRVQSYEEYLNITTEEVAPIKIITVEIEYKIGKSTENLEISTVLVDTNT